jgi:hypothetical protein
MRWLRRFPALAVALLLLVGVSCTSSDSTPEALGPSTEQQTPSSGLIGDLTGGLTDLTGDLTGTVVGTLGSVTDLLTCSEQPYVKSSETIGRDGGLIVVGRHWLFIPQGALSENVTITAEQMPGRTNSIRFSPEELRFQRPVTLTMNYENCALVLLKKKIVYTSEDFEIREVLRSLDLFRSKRVSAPIDHFSRYAVAY